MSLPLHAGLWLPGYLKNRAARRFGGGAAAGGRVWLAITDHYEPFWATRDESVAAERVARWRRLWPPIAARHPDSAGRPAQYSFFYPEEEYRPALLDSIAAMVRDGYGDVEIHLHHDGEGEQNFLDRMNGFKQTLHDRHGLLRKIGGRIGFGFIHGNWALDNSRPDGRWCGLNNEIGLLRDLGCYADFTMPCGLAPMQTRMINAIYWATDDPARPKSYDTGVPVRPGTPGSGDLLMITGPFGIRWRDRLKPRFEFGELASYDLATPYRVRRWLDLAPRIGRDIFVKLFAHGTQEKHSAALLDGGLDRLLDLMQRECAARGLQLRHATAWDMYQAVRAAAGL